MEILGIGTEIVEVVRIARLIERHGEQFLRRVFTDNEIRFCSARALANQHYTARWAGKRAVLKALGVPVRRGIRWLDVEIRQQPNEATRVALAGPLREVCTKRSVGGIRLAVDHCHNYATATAIIVEEEEF